MLYPINPVMTREEMLQFNRLRYLSTAGTTLQDWLIKFSADRKKLLLLLGKTERRLPLAQVALADVIASDPKNQRAIKDAETEVDNCTKLINRLTRDLENLKNREQSTGSQFEALDAQYAKIRADYPVAHEAFLTWGNVPSR